MDAVLDFTLAGKFCRLIANFNAILLSLEKITRRMRKASLLVVLGSVLSISACRKFKPVEWQPEFAIPLMHAYLDVESFLQDYDRSGLFVVDSQKVVTLVYRGSVELPSFQINVWQNQNFDISVPVPPLAGYILSDTLLKDTTIDLTFASGVRIDSLFLKNGLLEIQALSGSPGTAILRLELASTYTNGTTWKMNFNATDPLARGTLANTRWDMTVAGTRPGNALRVKIYLAGRQTVSLTGGTYNYRISLRNFSIHKLYGYPGVDTFFLPPDTVDIRIYRNWIGGQVYFADPKIKVHISNSLGMPFDIRVDTLDARQKGTLTFYAITYPQKQQWVQIDYPRPGQEGSAVTSTLATLDRNNSNIDFIISLPPIFVAYQADVRVSPSIDPSQTYFLIDTSRLQVLVDVELPLYGYLMGVTAADTATMDIPDDETITQATIIINAENCFPITVGIQLYLLDSSYNLMDSIIKPYRHLLPPGQVDPSTGNIIQPATQQLKIPLTGTTLRSAQKAAYLRLWAFAESIGADRGENVKIYSFYYVRVKVGATVKLSSTLNLNL